MGNEKKKIATLANLKKRPHFPLFPLFPLTPLCVSKTRNGKYTARFKGKHGGTFSSVLQAAAHYNEMARAFDEAHGITVAKYNDLSTIA